MRTRTLTLAVASMLVAGVGLAPTAHAFDLTGHWVGKWSCKGFDGAKFKGVNKTSTLEITQQLDGSIAANIDGGAGFFYNGTAVPDGAKPEKGEAILLACPTANTLGTDEAEIVRAAVKTKIATFKATFKALSIFADDVPEVGTCKYTYKRIDSVDPGVTPCPTVM